MNIFVILDMITLDFPLSLVKHSRATSDAGMDERTHAHPTPVASILPVFHTLSSDLDVFVIDSGVDTL